MSLGVFGLREKNNTKLQYIQFLQYLSARKIVINKQFPTVTKLLQNARDVVEFPPISSYQKSFIPHPSYVFPYYFFPTKETRRSDSNWWKRDKHGIRRGGTKKNDLGGGFYHMVSKQN